MCDDCVYPFYTEAGPDGYYVRRDMFYKLTKNHKLNKESQEEIKSALEEFIPSHMYWGSWTGYRHFGICSDITSKCKECVKKIIARETLKIKFLPYVLHYLYKPGGKRYKTIAKETLVGKLK